jgi:transposase
MLMLGSLDEQIAADHPIRRIKALADRALRGLSAVFESMYSETGRPSVPPERLLKAQLLIALFSVRSDRQFCEQLDYNLLFRWFLDMEMDAPSFDASAFSRNRERLIHHEVAEQFLAAIVADAKKSRLLSPDHFSVDGLLLDLVVSTADDFAERREGAKLIARITGSKRKTVGADKGYDAVDFVEACRRAGVTPHVAPNFHAGRLRSAIDRRTARHRSFRTSQIVRRKIEKIFGWLKTFGGLRRSRVRGLARTQLAARLAAATYNLLRIARLKPLGAMP